MKTLTQMNFMASWAYLGTYPKVDQVCVVLRVDGFR